MDVTENESFGTTDAQHDHKSPNTSKNMNNNCSIRTKHRYTKAEHRPLVVRWRSPVPGLAGGMVSWPVQRQDSQRIPTTGLTSLLWRAEEMDFLRRRMIEVKKKPVLMDSYDRVKDEPLVQQLKLDIIRKVNDSVTTNNIMQVMPHLTALSYGADDITDMIYREAGLSLEQIYSHSSDRYTNTDSLSQVSGDSSHYLSLRKSSSRNQLMATVNKLRSAAGSMWRVVTALLVRFLYLGDDIRPCISLDGGI